MEYQVKKMKSMLSVNLEIPSNLEESQQCWGAAYFVCTFLNVFCRPQVQFLPLSLVVPQFFIKGNSSNTPILFVIAIPRLRLVLSNIQPNRQAKPNWVQNNKKERENSGWEGEPQCATIYCCPPKAQMSGVTFQ